LIFYEMNEKIIYRAVGRQEIKEKNQQGGALGGIAGMIPCKGRSPGGIAMNEAANQVSEKRSNPDVEIKESTSTDGASHLTFDNALGTLRSIFRMRHLTGS
jgi:hypothetical protein